MCKVNGLFNLEPGHAYRVLKERVLMYQRKQPLSPESSTSWSSVSANPVPKHAPVNVSPPPQPAEQFPPPGRKVMGASIVWSGKRKVELDLWISSDELKVTTVFTAMVDWRAMHPSQDTSARLITASADEELQSYD